MFWYRCNKYIYKCQENIEFEHIYKYIVLHKFMRYALILVSHTIKSENNKKVLWLSELKSTIVCEKIHYILSEYI
jgi:hypothetical protein